MLVQYLTKGSTVEVTSDEDEFKGVWFEATVLGFFGIANSGKELVFVEYKSILVDENSSTPLREYVDMSLVRPVPPKEKVERFELKDAVDASHKDGWWTATITGVLEDSRYKVTFQNPPEELEFGVSDLRFHRDWVQGNWVRPGRKQFGFYLFYRRPNNQVMERALRGKQGEGHRRDQFQPQQEFHLHIV